MNAINILIKPSSSACGLRCKYCFYHSLAEHREKFFKGMMDEETMKNLIARSFESPARMIGFAFQGGEPTTIGLKFFQEFVQEVKLQNKKHPYTKVQYSLQTNGMNLDAEWCSFLKANNFLVGISLDGYKSIHDYYRVDAKGTPTFSKVINATKLLDKYGVDYNILSVITNQLCAHTGNIYRFFRKRGYRFLQFIPCLSEYNNEESEYALTSDNYKKFLLEIFRLWIKDYRKGVYISIRHIDNLAMQIMGRMPELCGANGKCNLQFVVEGDGSVYPCDFYCTDEYLLGNVNESSLSELSQTAVAKAFLKRVGHPSECNLCKHRSFCDSGCKRHFIERDGKKFNRYCDAYKEYFDYAVPLLKELMGGMRHD